MTSKFQHKPEKDLFEQLQTADKKVKKEAKFLLPSTKRSYNLSYENILFVVIAFVMFSIIFFSLGVEKGRRDIGYLETKDISRLRPLSGRLRSSGQAQQETGREKPGEGIQNSNQYNYVIQLASFKKKESAEEELARLNNGGYKADIKKSGDYYQIYIGGFAKERNAQISLKKLKERYKDCYIKKVESGE